MIIAAVVLAAGASSRLGEPKQLLRDQHGERLVHKVAREAMEAGCVPVCVVVGARANDVRDAVADLDVIAAENVDWSEGLSTSIRCGVAAALETNSLPAGAVEDVGRVYTDADGQTWLNTKTELTSFGGIDGVLLLTCDMPAVGRAHVQALMNEFNGANSPVASSYGNTSGIPAIFPAPDFAALQSLSGDTGAKAILKQAKLGVSLVELPGGALDLDTPEDVARWRAGIPIAGDGEEVA